MQEKCYNKEKDLHIIEFSILKSNVKEDIYKS